MSTLAGPASLLQAGRLTLDRRSNEAWKDGVKLSIPRQSLEVLSALLEHPGEIVTREDLRRRLWPDGTFVDFEHGLNVAVKKLRDALGDSAEHPQFIETLPRVGYRLIVAPDLTKVEAMTRTPVRWRMAAAGLAIAVAAGAGTWWLLQRDRHDRGAGALKVRRVTSLGTVVNATISPDGTYIAYTVSDRVRQSLWVKQTDGTTELQILPPDRQQVWGTRFTPDGKSIYYGLKTRDDPAGRLFKIAALGGPPVEILAGIDSAVSFSPDGAKIAFLRRNFPTESESALLTANADGSGIRVIATRRDPVRFVPVFFNAPSWSPDGGWIACSVAHTDRTQRGEMLAFRVDGSGEKRLSDHPWRDALQLEWLPDGSGLIAIASDEWPGSPQIWHVPLPGGRPRRITLDVLQYRLANVTADGTSLLTVGMETNATVWRVPLDDPKSATELTDFRVNWGGGIARTPAGEFLVDVMESGHPVMWFVSREGVKLRAIFPPEYAARRPAIARNGRDLALVVTTARGFELATGRIGDSHIRTIAAVPSWTSPAFTPDGRWLVFVGGRTGDNPRLFKVPFDGKSPVRLTDYPALTPAISPDGRWIAAHCAYPDENSAWALCVLPIDGGAPVKRIPFDNDENATVAWSADGKGLFTIGAGRDPANVYLQALDGSPPSRVTAFDDQILFDFAVDENELLVVRGVLLRDAYLISGFRE